MIGKGSWRWGWRWECVCSEMEQGLCSAHLATGLIYIPKPGKWRAASDRSLGMGRIFSLERVSTGPGMDFSFLSLSQGSWKWCLGLQSMGRKFGEFHGSLRMSRGQPSLHPSLCLSAEDPLCVLSGAHLSEQWWGNNPLEVILLNISPLCKWDKEQMQKLLPSPGLTPGTSGVFSQVLGLSYGTGEESKACAALGVQILRWVTAVLFRELDKSWGLCIWILACLQSEL